MATARRAAARETRGSQASDTPRLEWLLGALGALLLTGAVSYLVHHGLTRDDGPGAIRANVLDIRAAGDAYVVRFTAQNEGDETLAQLHLTGRLMKDGKETETARATIDYLPGRSSKEAGFYFRNDPRRYELQIRPEGFATP